MSITLKSNEEIEIMRKANMIVFEVHQELNENILPGVTTLDLDRIAKEKCESLGASPAFLNYPSPNPNVGPFPGVICASVNHCLLYTSPSPRDQRGSRMPSSA